MTQRYRCTVAYDGTHFDGWQVQPHARTVQGEIHKALGVVGGGEEIKVQGSGRTDSGVHAREQVFHFDARRPYACEKWQEAMNGVLPPDIQVMSVAHAPDGFHALASAVAKEYRYFLFLGPLMPPYLRHTMVRERRGLDVKRMREAAALLEGENDFLSFSANRGVEDKSTVRNLSVLRIEETEQGLVVRARSQGFLYKMVRQLVGCLLRVGRGDMSLDEVQALLDHPRRSHDAPSAPPQGLFLWQVWYDESEVNDG